MRKLVYLSCSWCETKGDYDEPEEALSDGWFHVESGEEELDFCSTDCLIAYL